MKGGVVEIVVALGGDGVRIETVEATAAGATIDIDDSPRAPFVIVRELGSTGKERRVVRVARAAVLVISERPAAPRDDRRGVRP